MSDSSPEREARIEALVEHYLDALQAGESPDRAALLAAHPEIADALGRRLDIVEAMHRLARSDTIEGDELRIQPDGRAIRVRCPHCGQPIQLVEPRPHEVTCRTCGTSFPVEPVANALHIPDLVPRTLGRFHVHGVLGRGTFGTVYKAIDPDLVRAVAVKVPRAGYFATDEEGERFLREARSAAQLHHPGIVKVLEIGRERGVPHIVSDFIDGPTLADVLTASRPGYREAAELVARVADALAYAHQSGIVHRDVKPSNILIGPSGRPLLTDFGLARRDEAESVVTLDGQVLGTPAYMAPEQAAGDRQRVGPGSDVYSLGVVLYVLLTGELPFRGNSRMLILQVLHDDPKAPRALDDKVPRDLETICLKAMAKEPARRYDSAADFAADLRRYLAGEPIRARRVGGIERAGRWCRRNPVVAGLGAAVAISLTIGCITSTILAVWAVDRSEVARRNLYAAKMNLAKVAWDKGTVDVTMSALESLRPGPGQDDLRGWEWHHLWRLCHDGLKVLKGHTDWVQSVHFSPDGRQVLTRGVFDSDVRLWDGVTGRELSRLNEARGATFSPDGRWLAVIEGNGVRLEDRKVPENKRLLRSALSSLERFSFSPDSRRIVAMSRRRDGTQQASPSKEAAVAITILDVAGERPPVTVEGLTRPPNSMSFSPDGRQIAAAGEDNAVGLWNAESGQRHSVFKGHQGTVSCVAFSPDGRRIASASEDRSVRVWDVSSGREVHQLLGHRGKVDLVAYSPEGRFLASASGRDSLVKIWDAATGRELMSLEGTANGIQCVAFGPDGRWIATMTPKEIILTDLASGRQLQRMRGHTGFVESIAVSPDGRRLASASDDFTVRIWDTSSVRGARELRGIIYDVAFSLDGRSVATVGWQDPASQGPKLWDLASGQEIRTLHGHKGSVQAVAFLPDGRLVSAGEDRTIRIWDPGSGRPLRTFDAGGEIVDMAISPDGQWIATTDGFHDAADDGRLRLWEAESGVPVNLPAGPGVRHVACLAISPDGRLIATGHLRYLKDDDQYVAEARLFDRRTGALVRSLVVPGPGIDEEVRDVAFSPDGHTVALAVGDSMSAYAGWVVLWDAEKGRVRRTLRGHDRMVCRISFSPDGRRLASISQDGHVKLWDLSTGEQVLSLEVDSNILGRVAFSPDGRWLAAGSPNLRLFDARPPTAEMMVEREALGLVEFLSNIPLLKAEVIARIQSDGTITEPVRRRALDLTSFYRDDPRRINAASWGVVAWPGRTSEAYRAALNAVEVALRTQPDDAESMVTLGAACYRLDRLREGLVSLTRAVQKKESLPTGLAFLAMTQHRLGQAAAQTTLVRLREVLSDPGLEPDGAPLALLREVEETLRAPLPEPGE